MKTTTKFTKLKLFSPIMAKGEAPYENPWDGGDDFRILTEPEKKKCRTEIYEAVSEMLDPLVVPMSLEHRIHSAVPTTEEKDGRLMLALNCDCFGALTESELDELCSWWETQVVEANEVLQKNSIPTKPLGKIYVYIWYMNGWAIEPIYVGEQPTAPQAEMRGQSYE